MNYELIIEDLKTWSKSELFYRDYYQTYADETAAEELFRREDVYDIDKQIDSALSVSGLIYRKTIFLRTTRM